MIHPSELKGSINIPPSKSQSHRAIIAASLSKGKSVISNIVYSDDIMATIGAMEKLGVKFVKNTHHLTVIGVQRISISDDNFVECNESGSTLRFLIPIFSLCKDKVVFTGKRSLFKRPMNIYEEIFDKLNLVFQKNEDSIIVSGALSPGVYEIPGNISSQFISGLLFALPLVKGDSKIVITGKFESKQYVDMTLETLKQFHILIEEQGNEYIIKGNQSYKSCNVFIEGDYSQLAFFAVLGTISGDVFCRKIPMTSHQPDRLILDYIQKMGGRIEVKENGIIIRKAKTIGAVLDVSQCPDIAPVLGILAGLSEGKTLIINAQRLKMKESNRLLSTYETLKSLGVQVIMNEDSLEITGRDSFEGGIFDSFQDHRIAMSIAVASSRANRNVLITNAEVINKSYPDFYIDLEKLGAKIEYIEE